MTTSKDDVKKWLKSIGKDRFWLSKELGAPKRTIDNWLAPGGKLPAKSILAIQRLMNGESDSSPSIVLDFTDEEWFVICEAMKAHKETFLEFVNTAIQNAAKEKEDARKKDSNHISPIREISKIQEHKATVIGNIAAGDLMAGDAIPYEVDVYRPLDKDEYILRVEGHSMEPEIENGSLVIMRKYTAPPVPSVNTIIQYHDERGVTLKKLGIRDVDGKPEYVLHAINPDFPEITPMDGGCISAIYVETIR